MTNPEMLSLAERCREIREWHKTGLLCDGALRELAKSMPVHDEHQKLRLAEDKTSMEAMDFVISLAATSAADNDIHESDGGVESKTDGASRCLSEHAAGETPQGKPAGATGKDALAHIAEAVKPTQSAAIDRRICEKPETAYSADRQIAGVAPGPSEATPSTAGSVREALERARGYIADDVKRKPSEYDPSVDLAFVDAVIAALRSLAAQRGQG